MPHSNTLTVLFGFGGSGAKTLAELAELLTTDPNAAKLAKDRIHVVLCDTDQNDLRTMSAKIRRAFADRCPGLEMKVDEFSLATDVDAFCDLVEDRIGRTRVSPEAERRAREHWWFDDRGPFSATRLPLPPSAGAGQCALVSHFLSWDKLERFERILESIDKHAVNERRLEGYSVDLIMIAGLAGGTGRGCWQSLALKAREYFGLRNQSCRPIGFFFDQSVFEDVQRGHPEQRIKFNVNALTGLSELAMWLRSDTRMEGDEQGDVREHRYSLPHLLALDSPESDIIDTERYMPEAQRARVGRSPIHKAFIFTNRSSSMHLGQSGEVYRVCASAVYGRIMLGQLRSVDANQPSRAAATATSVLYVPITDIRIVVQAEAKKARIESMLVGSGGDRPAVVDCSLTGKGRIAVEIRDEQSAANVKAMVAGVTDFLGIHEHVPSGPVQRRSPHGRHLAAMEQRSDEIREELSEAFRTGDQVEFVAALDRLGQPPANLVVSMSDAFSTVLSLDEERRAELGHGRDAAEQVSRWALERLVLGRGETSQVGRDQTILGLGLVRGGSLALALEALRSLEQGIEQSINSLSKASKDAESPGVQAREAAIKQFAVSRRRLTLPGLRSRFGSTEVDNLVHAARSVQRASELPEVTRLFKRIAEHMLQRVRSWREATEDVVGVMLRTQNQQQRDVKKLRDACFTNLEPRESAQQHAREVLRVMKNDESSAVTRVRRRLRPLFDQQVYDRIVGETLSERSGLQASQADFCMNLFGGMQGETISDRSIIHWKERRPSDRYRLEQSVEVELSQLLAKQSTPASAMHAFTLDAVLDALVTKWFDLYRDNRGDAAFCDDFARHVQHIVGIDLARLAKEQEGSEDPSPSRFLPPPREEIMASTALALATTCDPLVRLPKEELGTGDLITVLLPDVTFGKTNIKPHESWQNEIEQRYKSRPREFRHVKCTLLHENPYMLVVVSDHPKRDFDQRAWCGWDSFSYWSDPAFREWLQMVEDPAGASVFMEGKDDSIGLGYLDPRVVRVAHWSRRRWRPWFDPTRERSQDRRKWEAIAYAFLGNEVCDEDGRPADAGRHGFLAKYREFCTLFNARVLPNPDYAAEKWLLPLVAERPGDKEVPQFTRGLFRTTADGLRRDAAPPVARFPSMLRFVDWFSSDDSQEVLERVWQEQIIFARFIQKTANSTEDVASALHGVTSRDHRRDIRLAMKEYVERWLRAIEGGNEREDDKQKKVEFLRQFHLVFTSPEFDLLHPFDEAVPTG